MRSRRIQLAAAVAVVAVASVLVTTAVAGGDGDRLSAKLTGFEEVPAVSTGASGKFDAKLRAWHGKIQYKLSYRDLEGDVTQAHIHFAQPAVNGAIVVWLCGNNPPVANTPPGTQPCPPSPATITGTIEKDDVVGVPAQGIDAGEFDALLGGIDAGVTYANVHSSKFPGGEVRGQIGERDW
jgi:CHRD domain